MDQGREELNRRLKGLIDEFGLQACEQYLSDYRLIDDDKSITDSDERRGGEEESLSSSSYKPPSNKKSDFSSKTNPSNKKESNNAMMMMLDDDATELTSPLTMAQSSMHGSVIEIGRDDDDEDTTVETDLTMKAMLEGAFDGIICADERGVIRSVNRAALKQFGYNDNDDTMIGKNVSMLAGGGHGANHDQYLDNYLKTGHTKLIGTQRELPARRKDGSEFMCQLGIKVIELLSGGDRKKMYVTTVRDISQEVRARKLALENAFERQCLSAIVDASFDGLLATNTNGIITKVNRAALRMFGYENSFDLLGKNIKVVVGGGHADNHDNYREEFLRTRKKRIMGSEREVWARRKDGTEFPVILGLDFVEPSGGGVSDPLFVGFVRDISTRKRADRLEEENAREQQIRGAMLDGAFDGMVCADQYGTILTVNNAAMKQFGYDNASEMVGKNVSMIAGGGHGERHDDYLARFRETGEHRLVGTKRELFGRRKDNSEFPCQLGIEIIHVGGRMLYVTSVRDITQDVKARKLSQQGEFERQTLTAILDSAFDALVVASTSGIITRVNAAAVKLFKYQHPNDLVGQNLKVLVGGGHAANHDKYLERYMRTREKHIMGSEREVQGRRRDGSEFPAILGLNLVETSAGDSLLVGFVRDMSSEKRTKKLEKQKMDDEKVRLAMLDGAFDSMICADEFGVIKSVNKATIKQFGYSGEHELIGQNVSILAGGMHGEMHDSYLANFRKTGKHKLVGTMRELPGRRKDKTEFPCQLGIEVIEVSNRPMYVTSIRDITHDKRARQLANENAFERRYLSAIVNAAFDGLVAANTSGIITRVNAAASKMFGYEPNEMLGQNLKIIVGGGHAVHHDRYIETFLRTREKRMIGMEREISARKKDGSEFPAMLGLSFVEPEVGDALFVGFVRDITSKKRLEAATRDARDQEERSRAMMHAMSMLSHELRTPLQGIMGVTSMLLMEQEDLQPADSTGPSVVEKKVDSRMYEDLCTIQGSSQLLLTLINNLLDVRKFENGMMETLELERLDLNGCILESLQCLKPVSMLHEMPITPFGIEEDAHTLVLGVGLRVQQILFNLVGNAVKYSNSETNGKGVDIMMRESTLAAARKEAYEALSTGATGKSSSDDDSQYGHSPVIIIDVRDYGDGIPVTEAHKVFGEFQMMSKHSGKSKGVAQPTGSGLGLHLCATLADKMEGCIWANNCNTKNASAAMKNTVDREKGCVFSFFLKRIAEEELDFEKIAKVSRAVHKWKDATETTRKSISIKSARAAEISKMKVMIVDDVQINIKVLSRMLKLLGVVHLRAASSGSAAMELLKEDDACDAIFTDDQMPGMSGTELIAKASDFYSERAAQQPQSVVCSADNSADLTERALAAGAVAVLSKPFTVNQLGDFLDKLR